MTTIEPTKARIDALGPSPLHLPPLNRYETDVANTPLPRCVSGFANSVGPLRDASQRHNGQMTPPAVMLDDQFDHRPGSSSRNRVRCRGWQTMKPRVSRFQAGGPHVGIEIDESPPKGVILMDVHRLRWPVTLWWVASPGAHERKSSSSRNP